MEPNTTLDDLFFLLDGCSGKLGNRFYYRRNGKTFIRKAPGSYNKVPSPKQALQRELFRKANAFAKKVISDPLLKAQYQAIAVLPCSVYDAAIADYMKKNG